MHDDTTDTTAETDDELTIEDIVTGRVPTVGDDLEVSYEKSSGGTYSMTAEVREVYTEGKVAVVKVRKDARDSYPTTHKKYKLTTSMYYNDSWGVSTDYPNNDNNQCLATGAEVTVVKDETPLTEETYRGITNELADRVSEYIDENPDLSDDVYGITCDEIRFSDFPSDISPVCALQQSDYEPDNWGHSSREDSYREGMASLAEDALRQDVLAELTRRDFLEYDLESDPSDLFNPKGDCDD